MTTVTRLLGRHECIVAGMVFAGLAEVLSAQSVIPIRERVTGAVDDPTAALTVVAYATVAFDSVLIATQPLEHHLKLFGRFWQATRLSRSAPWVRRRSNWS